MTGRPGTLWLRTMSGPVIRADRLVSLSVLYPDGHHVDFDRPVTWRDEPVYLTAFFDYLEYGMPLAGCRVGNALPSMHSFMGRLAELSDTATVLGAVPSTDPVRWVTGQFLPPLQGELESSQGYDADITDVDIGYSHVTV